LKKTMLMAVLLAGAAFASNASAATTAYTAYDGVYNLIYGNLGSPTYGTITVTYIGADSVSVHESVSPNWLLNNGNLTNLAPLTFNLNGTGVIREGSVEAPFSIATVLPVANPPWGNFTSAINGNCGPGSSSGGCGSTLDFIIDHFQGFNANVITYDDAATLIYFASDIINNAGSGGTGAVGAGGLVQTPIPPAVALFGLGLAGIGLLKRATKKRNANLDIALS
jgi:hypothetical protein